jgi:hypothetical protein
MTLAGPTQRTVRDTRQPPRSARPWTALLVAITAAACPPADPDPGGTDARPATDMAAPDAPDAPDAPADVAVPEPDAPEPDRSGDLPLECPGANDWDAAVCNTPPFEFRCTEGLAPWRPGSTAGQPNLRSSYPCIEGEGGGEIAYHFRSDIDRDVEVGLNPRNRECRMFPEGGYACTSPILPWEAGARDLDLIVLRGPGPDSAEATCVSGVPTRGYQRESPSFRALAGQDYWLVVDSPPGQEGPFDLAVHCKSCLSPLRTLACDTTIETALASRTVSATSRYLPELPQTDETHAGQLGFEDVFDLPSAEPTNYTVRLTGLSRDLNLFLVTDPGQRCEDLPYVAASANPEAADEVLRFAGRSDPVRLVVDGPEAVASPYRLEVGCAPACDPRRSADCGLTQRLRNDQPVVSYDRITSWGSCASGLDGPEVTYWLEGVRRPGQVTVVLSGLTADLDLIVLRGLTSGFRCDPTTACLASSTTPGTADERVTFDVDPSSRYVIAVDGRDGAVSDYQLTVEGEPCAP